MESKKTSSAFPLFFLGLFLVASAVAVKYRKERNDCRDRLLAMKRAIESGGELSAVPGHERGDAPPGGSESAQIYSLLNSLARKDALIADLRNQVADIRAAKTMPARPPRMAERPAVELPESNDPSPAPAPGIGIDIGPPVGTIEDQESFLRSLDTSRFTERQVSVHKSVLRLLSDVRLLADKLNRDTDGTAGENTRARLSDSVRALRLLLVEERAAVLGDMAVDLGYDDAGTEAFASYVWRVCDATSPNATATRIAADLRTEDRPAGLE